MNEECEVLRQLRHLPQIFDRLRDTATAEFRIQNQLRREFPDAVVRAALTLRELRIKAVAKFSRAEQMWFDRQGLEQSTSEAVARHKSQRFHGTVRDYCCGIGADAIALAERCEVIAVDRNPAAVLRTSWNADVYGVSSNVQTVCADVEQLNSGTELVHIDPDRRVGRARSANRSRWSAGTRALRVEDGVPGLKFLQRLMREFSGGAVKLSPASNFAGKFPGAELELISVAGECKEATVWFGQLATADGWRATVLPAGATLAGDPLAEQAEVGPLANFLYDPDPAVVRAGLVDRLANRTGLWRLDEAEEYLTGELLVESPFVRSFQVLAELPNNTRKIRRYVRDAEFAEVEIKCRHIPIQAEAVRRKLPLQGHRKGVLIFARIAGKARAIVCRRVVYADAGA